MPAAGHAVTQQRLDQRQNATHMPRGAISHLARIAGVAESTAVMGFATHQATILQHMHQTNTETLCPLQLTSASCIVQAVQGVVHKVGIS